MAFGTGERRGDSLVVHGAKVELDLDNYYTVTLSCPFVGVESME
jgi:hypothetical protein